MKFLKSTLLLLIATLVLFSCRTEEIKIIDPPVKNALVDKSPVVRLMNRTALRDGSKDNIIDKASCITVKLPVTVTVNSNEITIDNEDGYKEIEDLFDLFDDDVDTVEIKYPIEVILSDHTVKTVNSDAELKELAGNCNGENEEDDDIECLDFEYPFSASVFNENNDLILTLTLEDDEQLFKMLNDLEQYAAVTINFPIKVKLSNDTLITINNLQELEEAINTAVNSCDEDDDNDYNDDDCDTCTTDILNEFFGKCEEWKVDRLKINGEDYTDNYEKATFYFRENGSLKIIKNGNISEGEWTASGEANNIMITINVDGFDKFNKTWTLHELDTDTDEIQVSLFSGEDKLRFESSCNKGSNSGDNLSETLASPNNVWVVEKYSDNGENLTQDFAEYEFYFETSGVVKAKKGTSIHSGDWKSLDQGAKLSLEFEQHDILERLNEGWKVVELSESQIMLKTYTSSGTIEDILIFNKK
ncbi:hypothetical protein [uncultured Tenacibaculum sp.]|uniref:hypothetical protein n=1 Tax=uncultured Tenacibaculum sp. TaxID=174713 RepID=UPI0026156F7C|nr:hypothetical protein [uncultured Tenacibaculum sp.]